MSAALRLLPDVDTGDADRDLSPLEQWELYMRGAGRSNRSINNTILVIRHLERFAECRLENVRPLDIARFLGRPRLKQHSRASYFGYIHSFYRWWEQNGGTNPAAKVVRPKSPKLVPKPITTAQLTKLLAIRMHRRTRVMVLLGAFAGLRIHEIAKIRGEDVDPDARTLRVVGKGGVTAVIPLHPLLVEAARGMPRRGWWFPGNSRRRGLPVHSRSVGDIVANAMDRAGIPGGTAHRLRHWYGTTLVEDGADLRTVQTLLRHVHLNTTAGYVLVSDPKRVEAIDRLFLRGNTDEGRAVDAPTTRGQTSGAALSARALGVVGDRVDACKSAIVLVLEKVDPGQHMPRWKLSEAVRSGVRPQLDAALDELIAEGLVATGTSERGALAYCLACGPPRP